MHAFSPSFALEPEHYEFSAAYMAHNSYTHGSPLSVTSTAEVPLRNEDLADSATEHCKLAVPNFTDSSDFNAHLMKTVKSLKSASRKNMPPLRCDVVSERKDAAFSSPVPAVSDFEQHLQKVLESLGKPGALEDNFYEEVIQSGARDVSARDRAESTRSFGTETSGFLSTGNFSVGQAEPAVSDRRSDPDGSNIFDHTPMEALAPRFVYNYASACASDKASRLSCVSKERRGLTHRLVRLPSKRATKDYVSPIGSPSIDANAPSMERYVPKSSLESWELGLADYIGEDRFENILGYINGLMMASRRPTCEPSPQ